MCVCVCVVVVVVLLLLFCCCCCCFSLFSFLFVYLLTRHMGRHTPSSGDLAPLLDGGCCCTRGLSWLKIVPI